MKVYRTWDEYQNSNDVIEDFEVMCIITLKYMFCYRSPDGQVRTISEEYLDGHLYRDRLYYILHNTSQRNWNHFYYYWKDIS